jgi:two-component system chemotaxis sensor kinase CheA
MEKQNSIWNSLCQEVLSEVVSSPQVIKADFCALLVHLSGDFEGALTKSLAELGLNVVALDSAEDAVKFVQENLFRLTLVFVHADLLTITGFEFRSQIIKSTASIPFVILSSDPDQDRQTIAPELKVAGVFGHPIPYDPLAEAIGVSLRARVQSLKEDRELLGGFIEETKNLLDQIEILALGLEENPSNQEMVNQLFGIIHTIKGTSAFFEPKTLHEFIHRFEEVLKRVQNKTLKICPKVISTTLKVVDLAKVLIQEHQTQAHQQYDLDELCQVFLGLTAAEEEASVPHREDQDPPISFSHRSIPVDADVGPQLVNASSPRESDIKIDRRLLDEFLRASGEMTVVRNMVNKSISTLEKRYSSDKDVSHLTELLDELNKVNGMIQAKITEVRKVPLKVVFKPLSRLVRDVSVKTKKNCVLEVVGDELRIDSSLAEVLMGSITHLIRNSVDHGIESAEVRVQSGKSEKGLIRVHAFLKNDQVIVEVGDDGGGLDTEAIRRKLLAQGIQTGGDVTRMSAAEIHQFIFASGLSTAEKTTEISGRGVGMSAVKSSVEGIGGVIKIETQSKKGTKFILELPIPKSVHIKNCLFVKAGGQEFGISQDQITRILDVNSKNKKDLIYEVEGGEVLRLENDHTLPLVCLSELLFSSKKSERTNQYQVIILRTESGKEYALMIDDMRDFEDAVVKELVPVLKKIRGFSGSTFLSDGTVGLLLSVDGLAQLSHIRVDQLSGASAQDPRPATLIQEPSKDWLLLELESGQIYAVLRSSVFRIEEFNRKNIDISDFQMSTVYRDQVLPILGLEDLLSNNFNNKNDLNKVNYINDKIQVIIMYYHERYIGFKVKSIVDSVNSHALPEQVVTPDPGFRGNIVLNGKIIAVVDPVDLLIFSKEKNDLEFSAQNSVFTA